MRLVVLGATGGIGARLMARALADGHTVRAVARDAARVTAPHGVEVVEATLTDTVALEAAFSGADAVLSALGPSRNDRAAADALVAGMANVLTAMRAAGVTRIVAVSGAGIAVAGERKPLSGRVAAWVVRRLARWVVDAKQREYELLRASGLAWTAVRPPRVVDGEASGGVELSLRLGGAFTVSQGDVAAAMLRCAAEGLYVCEAPFVFVPG